MSVNTNATVTITNLVNSVRQSQHRLDRLKHLVPVFQPSATVSSPNDIIMISAGFGAVFKMRDPRTNRHSALKCFLQIKSDRRDRYTEIAGHFSGKKFPWLLDFLYYDAELSVKVEGQTADLLCPVLSMSWIDGQTLGVMLVQLSKAGDQRTLYAFCQKWATLCQEMIGLNFAHGDIKADNIVIAHGDNFVLVDYDSMFVPGLAGKIAADLGGPSFQHPNRRPADFDTTIDNFPMLVLAINLRALAVAPSLFGQVLDSDHLLFRQKDFQYPDQSTIFRSLFAQGDPWLTAATKALAEACRSSSLAISDITRHLDALYHSPIPKPEHRKVQSPPTQSLPPAKVQKPKLTANLTIQSRGQAIGTYAPQPALVAAPSPISYSQVVATGDPGFLAHIVVGGLSGIILGLILWQITAFRCNGAGSCQWFNWNGGSSAANGEAFFALESITVCALVRWRFDPLPIRGLLVGAAIGLVGGLLAYYPMWLTFALLNLMFGHPMVVSLMLSVAGAGGGLFLFMETAQAYSYVDRARITAVVLLAVIVALGAYGVTIRGTQPPNRVDVPPPPGATPFPIPPQITPIPTPTTTPVTPSPTLEGPPIEPTFTPAPPPSTPEKKPPLCVVFNGRRICE